MGTIRWGESVIDLQPDPRVVAPALVTHGRVVAERFRDTGVGDQKVTGLTWTVHELAAHLAATAENYAKMAAGVDLVRQPLADRQQVIDRAIEERRQSSLPALANAIESGAGTLAATFDGADADTLVSYYGVMTPLWVVAGMCLTELVVHGNDLFRTVGGSEPDDQPAAYQAFLAGSALCPFVLTDWGKQQRLTLGYRARGMVPVVVHLKQGTVDVGHEATEPVDVWFEGTAKHLLLTAYHRTGLLGGLRVLRMKGRRPYRALTAQRAFGAA